MLVLRRLLFGGIHHWSPLDHLRDTPRSSSIRPWHTSIASSAMAMGCFASHKQDEELQGTFDPAARLRADPGPTPTTTNG